MTTPKQPREFWIEIGKHSEDSNIRTTGEDWEMHFNGPPTHVIEKFAYDELKAENERLNRLLKDTASHQARFYMTENEQLIAEAKSRIKAHQNIRVELQSKISDLEALVSMMEEALNQCQHMAEHDTSLGILEPDSGYNSVPKEALAKLAEHNKKWSP